MPYKIEHTSPRCWTVKNTKTGQIKAKCTSQKKAEAQLRLLYGLESGWKPSTYKQMEKLHDLKPRRENKGGAVSGEENEFKRELHRLNNDALWRYIWGIRLHLEDLRDAESPEVGRIFTNTIMSDRFRNTWDGLNGVFVGTPRNRMINLIVEGEKLINQIKYEARNEELPPRQVPEAFPDIPQQPPVDDDDDEDEMDEDDWGQDEEEGGYLESFKRKPGLLPPPVRKILEKIGDEKITSLKIVRTPLSKFVSTLLNVISLGAYKKAVNESPYDSMFHLAMLINGKYTTEKNEVIKLYQGTPVKKNSETFDLPVSKNITIGELFENGRKKMGDENFTNYDARSNNCQDFLLGLLDGSGLTTDGARKFIKQDAEVIFKKMPSVSEKIGRFLTDVASVGERVMEGEGFKETWIIQGGRLVPVLIGGEIPEDVRKMAKAKYELKKATEEYEKLLPEKDKPQLLPDYTQLVVKPSPLKQEPPKVSKDTTKKVVKYYGDKDVEIHKGPFIARRSGGTDTQWSVWHVQKILKVGLNRQQAIDLIESLYESQNLLKTTSDKRRSRVSDKVKKSSVPKKKKMADKPKTTKTWKDFYASQVKGKKFANRSEVNAFMRECSKKWKELKQRG